MGARSDNAGRLRVLNAAKILSCQLSDYLEPLSRQGPRDIEQQYSECCAARRSRRPPTKIVKKLGSQYQMAQASSKAAPAPRETGQTVAEQKEIHSLAFSPHAPAIPAESARAGAIQA